MKRDTENAMIFGVCSGLAKYFKIDALILRLIFVIATVAGIGTPVLIYLILAILMPEEQNNEV